MQIKLWLWFQKPDDNKSVLVYLEIDLSIYLKNFLVYLGICFWPI